jgi:hypothetical protein
VPFQIAQLAEPTPAFAMPEFKMSSAINAIFFIIKTPKIILLLT